MICRLENAAILTFFQTCIEYDPAALLVLMDKLIRASLAISFFVLGVSLEVKAGDGVFVSCDRKNNYPLQARIYHQRGGIEIYWATGVVNKLAIADFEKSVYKDQNGLVWSEASVGLNDIKLKQGDYVYSCRILDRF